MWRRAPSATAECRYTFLHRHILQSTYIGNMLSGFIVKITICVKYCFITLKLIIPLPIKLIQFGSFLCTREAPNVKVTHTRVNWNIYKFIIAQSTEARKTKKKKKKKLKVPLKCDIYGSFVQVLMMTWEILPPMYLMYLCTSLYLGT